MKRKGYVYHDEKEQCWYARVTITEGGKRRNMKRRATSKSAADDALKGLLRQLDDEGGRAIDFNRLTFNDLADYYERHYLKPAEYVEGQKVSGYRALDRPKELLKHFRAYFGKRRLREITYGDLVSYRALRLRVPTAQKRQRTISTWNREAAVLRRILNIGRQQGWLVKNPFHCGDPLILTSAERRRERILALEEEQRLLEACDSHPYRRPLRPLLIFLLDTGCRKGEALKLRWKCVSFSSRVITIEASTTKTLRARQVVMTERVCRELQALKQGPAKGPDDRVFGIADNVKHGFASVCKVAGIKHGGIDGLTLHCLRHTAATRLVQGGLGLELAGRILGHSQVNTTYRYVTANLDTAVRAAAILEGFQGQAGPLSREGIAEVITEAVN